ncbi:MAG TPA: class I SAM-dependent methyltransferase [Puia sp.]
MKDYILNGRVFVDADDSEIFGYSDGDEAENYILDSLQSAKDLSTGSEELQNFIKDWPSLYHLNPKRVNLLRPLEDKLKGRNILEIGSGCGAITRYLGETASAITALEGSFQRAQITAERCRDLSNVKVICDNFQHFSTPEKFDVITLIGVLEYANIYIKEDEPVKTMLSNIRAFLKPGGIVLIAIENKLGLKYWAGAPEDHTGQAYLGIENRYSSSTAVTFGKKELETMLRISGYSDTSFLYPFPDYKLPDSIVTDPGLRTKGFSVPMLLLEDFEYIQSNYYSNHFSTSLVAAELDRNGLLADFSNSFLVIASPDALHDIVSPDLLAVKYNSQRKKEYQKFSVFRSRQDEILVEKRRMYSHLPLPQSLVENTLDEEPYFQGRLLLFDAIKVVSQKQWSLDSLAEWSRQYFDILKDLSSDHDGQWMIEGKYLDLTPFNIVIGEHDEVRIFDQEWKYPGELPLGYIFFRGINYSLGAISFFNIPANGVAEDILELTCALYRIFLPLQNDTVDNYRKLEIKNLSEIRSGDYIPFLPAPLKIRVEMLKERQNNVLEQNALELKNKMTTEIEQLQVSLAHANHTSFIREAELDVLRQMAAQPRVYPEIDKITTEIAQLSGLIAAQPSITADALAPSPALSAELDSLALLKSRIANLENDLQWYRKTYEERSLLGVMRQKIATKFAK